MNILVTALSLYRAQKPEQYVLSAGGRCYTVTGNQTNEPVPMALKGYLADQKQTLDQIILLCTPATLEQDSGGKTSVQRFCEAMENYWGSQSAPCFKTICLAAEADSAAIYNASMELLELLTEADDPVLYLDSTGGFRDSMMFFISMLQLLKERGIRVADVFYALYDRNQEGPYPITSRMDAYRVYDLVSGMEELRTYGDPRKLKEYFRSKKISSQAEQILNDLQNLYAELQLCRVEQSSKVLLRLTRHLEEYTPGDSTFDSVVALAKTKYGGVRDGFGYVEYIKWYFDHGYIPQTLAFIYETLPDLLVENRVLYHSPVLNATLESKKDTVVTRRTENYTFLNKYFKDTYLPVKQQEARAKAELAAMYGEEEITLTEKGQQIKEAVDTLLLAKTDILLAVKPVGNTKLFLDALFAGKTPGLSQLDDVLACPDGKEICRLVCTDNGLIRRLYGIEKPDADMPPEKHARLIIEAIDGKDILLGEGVDKALLEQLLEKYFYLKNQRNSVLHVGQASASPKTLLHNIETAIALLDAVLGGKGTV